MPPLFRLRDLTVRRVDRVRNFLLEIPFLEVRAGDFIVARGPSGCGKSTLLDLLGLILPCETAAEFSFHPSEEPAGTSVARSAEPELARLRSRHVGRVLQSGGLLAFLTCEQNVLLPGRILGRAAAPEELGSLAKRLNINDQLGKHPQALSGGQQQRVAIARALLHRPAVVLADEPTASVDRPQGAEIFGLLHELAQERGIAVVVATHDVGLAEQFRHRALTFNVVTEGPEAVRGVCREAAEPDPPR